jgi:LysR family transcriptional regulator, low CO2-responsive transcriptional regulator
MPCWKIENGDYIHLVWCRDQISSIATSQIFEQFRNGLALVFSQHTEFSDMCDKIATSTHILNSPCSRVVSNTFFELLRLEIWLLISSHYSAIVAGMTLHQLRVFLAVARHSSITKASHELHISEPSVHQQVKSLQMNFSRSLYHKVGRGIEITSDGRAFSTKASEILRKADELERHFGQTLTARRPRNLAVGGSHVLSASILAPIVATFESRHSDVQVEFKTKSSQFVERLVWADKIDLGLVTNATPSSLLIMEPFRYEEMVAIISRRHALSRKRQLTMAELAQVPLIIRTRRKSSSNQILEEIEQHGLELNVVMKCDSAQAVKVAVTRGLGIGFLYRSHVEQEIRTGELKVLNVTGLRKHVQSFIIYKAGRPLSPAAQECLELLRRSRPAKPTWTRRSDHLKPREHGIGLSRSQR